MVDDDTRCTATRWVHRQVGPPPEAEQLGYKHTRGEELVGRPILFNWKAVGWCSGTIQNINADGRKKVKVGSVSQPANFFVHYEHDDSEALHCLRLDEHGVGDAQDFSRWVLLKQDESFEFDGYDMDDGGFALAGAATCPHIGQADVGGRVGG